MVGFGVLATERCQDNFKHRITPHLPGYEVDSLKPSRARAAGSTTVCAGSRGPLIKIVSTSRESRSSLCVASASTFFSRRTCTSPSHSYNFTLGSFLEAPGRAESRCPVFERCRERAIASPNPRRLPRGSGVVGSWSLLHDYLPHHPTFRFLS